MQRNAIIEKQNAKNNEQSQGKGLFNQAQNIANKDIQNKSFVASTLNQIKFQFGYIGQKVMGYYQRNTYLMICTASAIAIGFVYSVIKQKYYILLANFEDKNANILYQDNMWVETAYSLGFGYTGGSVAYVWFYLILPQFFKNVTYLGGWLAPLGKTVFTEILNLTLICFQNSNNPSQAIIDHYSLKESFGVGYTILCILMFKQFSILFQAPIMSIPFTIQIMNHWLKQKEIYFKKEKSSQLKEMELQEKNKGKWGLDRVDNQELLEKII